MMVLAHRFDLNIAAIGVYADAKKQDLALYGFYWDVDRNYSGSVREDHMARMGAVRRTEETEELTVTQTLYQICTGYFIASAKLEICGRQQDQSFHQVLLTDRLRFRLGSAMEPVTIWDGNADGYEDILLYAGYDGGSGGTWDFYHLFTWSEEKGCFVEMAMPQVVAIDYENHKLYDKGQVGVAHQYYCIYGLHDGAYQVEKQLYLDYGMGLGEDGAEIATATYKEWGKTVEEVDITGLDWTETKELLEGKFPEFNFWREG